MKYIAKILPHISIIMAGVMLTLLVIDKFNTQMGFIDHAITKNIMIAFCIVAVICAIMLTAFQRKSSRED